MPVCESLLVGRDITPCRNPHLYPVLPLYLVPWGASIYDEPRYPTLSVLLDNSVGRTLV